MSNKKNLQDMSIAELLEYQQQQRDLFKKLLFECENWSKNQILIKNELRARTEELDFLELEAELDRKNQPQHLFEVYNNLH